MADDKNEVPPDVVAWMRRLHAMRRETSDELIGRFWEFAADGDSQLHFVLEGNIEWKAEAHLFALPGAVVAPDIYEPPGARASSPFETYSPRKQFRLSVSIDPIRHSLVQESRASITHGVRRAAIVADAFSLLSEQSISIRPARKMSIRYGSDSSALRGSESTGEEVVTYMPLPFNREQTGIVVDDQWMRNGLGRFLHVLQTVPDVQVKRAIEVALSWHAQANQIAGLGQYAFYWSSIELLANFVYEYCDPTFTGRKTELEVHAAILEKIIDLRSSQYAEALKECGELLRPTARTKVKALLKCLLPDRNDIRGMLFAKQNGADGKPMSNSKSLYDIRNDVAHGNVSELDRDYYDLHAARLSQFRRVSGEFVIAALNSSQAIIRNRRK